MTQKLPIFEVCVDSVSSAINAEKECAARIELCDNLSEGGTTPSSGMIATVRKYVKIPIMVMIRPRGGDFCYSDHEFEVMCADIEHAKSLGADGVVFGILLKDGRIDVQKTGQSSQAHVRAFDMCKDPYQSLEDIIAIGGIQRVLTSGCDSTVLEGLEKIALLVEQARDRIIVMPGGGIRKTNIKRILKEIKLKEIHVSASASVSSSMEYRTGNVHMGRPIYNDEFTINTIDRQKLRDMMKTAKEIN
ncbi:1341_t:CDS:10 [Ambispora leptoticha]|uniref:Copper homeostasis protein cutC homolog n=1 Tax=Ambispora leptoticha TaxID=144679 RepID=A0A9N8V1U6_9GLOM|nr:1341_t:CDS:10 [Ambispora leptoticha]